MSSSKAETFLGFLETPTPQKLNVLIFFAVWIWYFIIKYLNSYKIDLMLVLQLRLPGDMHQPPTNGQLQRFSYAFALKLTKIFIPCHILSNVVFNNWNENDLYGTSHFVYHSLPLFQFLTIIFVILRESDIMRYCTKRLLLIESTPFPLRNVYILLSDTLTSFNKPLISFTLFTSLNLGKPLTHFDLFLSSLPSGVRIFQCLREYYLVKDKSLLFNTGKYCLNLPVIICTWYLRIHNSTELSSTFYTVQSWFLLLNSSYAFFWDVRMDWMIPSIIELRKSKMMFKPRVYYLGIYLDFVIRFWWIWVFFYSQNNIHKFIFFDCELYYLEIIRRANWVIFKLESEYTNRQVKN